MVGSPDYSTTWGRAGQGRAGTSTAPCTVGWRRSAEAHPGRQASSLDIQDAGQGGGLRLAAGCQLKLWPWGFTSEPWSTQPSPTCATGMLVSFSGRPFTVESRHYRTVDGKLPVYLSICIPRQVGKDQGR